MQDIVAAHEAAVREGVEGLDDASLVVRLRPVALVLGDRLNIKVTTPEDLELARVLVANGVVK
jgi:2-C-methyl-D-erythritol 4-phosphate cytidylyltransferase